MSTEISWCHYMAPNGKVIKGETLNPIKGCSKAGYMPPGGGHRAAHPGCINCYAARWVKGPYPGCKPETAKWDGTIEVFHDRMLWPFQKTGFTARKDGHPRIVFLCSQSDMGHPNVPLDVWMAIQGMMILSPWNIYKDLTKRPELQLERLRAHSPADCVRAFYRMLGLTTYIHKDQNIPDRWEDVPNIHRYVSVSDQSTADSLVPDLLAMPAAVRGVSLEPMVGPVNLAYSCFNGADSFGTMPGIDHIIVGGESGHGAMPCDVAWARAVMAECREAGVPFYMKQLGAKPMCAGFWPPKDPKGADPMEWPADLRVQMQVGEEWR